jgi:Mycothiol maleylpyruvate isomerase N-terminal domain
MTAEQSVPSKAILLEALRSSEEEVLAKLRALTEADFEQGRYENGWSARQILAHVASIEWTYPRLIDVAKQRTGTPAEDPPAQEPRGQQQEEAQPPARTARGGIGDYNERQVGKRANASVTELLAEFEKNRAATIEAVEAADETLLTAPIRSAGGITGALANVIQAVAVLHVLGHVNDIVGAADAPTG